MTAPIINHEGDRHPWPEALLDPWTPGGIHSWWAVKGTGVVPGQLWERIAEATPKILGPAYTQRLMDATLNAYIRSGERDSILYGLTSIDDE